MKNRKTYAHLTIADTRQPLNPNAADHRYFQRKALDVLTAIASGCGLFTAMIFLITMI